MKLFANLSRGRRLLLGGVLAVVTFISVNVAVGNFLPSVRADLTDQKLFTLSQGTQDLLASIDEPVHLRFFMSSNLIDVAPLLANYASRVRETLAAYEQFSNGQVKVEIIDPKPFSDEEDRAVGMGINPIPAGDEQSVFFGLAGTNSTSGKASLPVFSPDREPFLEYDLTRMVAELGKRGKPVLALFDGIGLSGNPINQSPPQQVIVQLRQFFDVQLITGDLDKLPDNTGLVMLVHPQKMSDRLLYTVDQWTVGGGATFIFVDPYAENMPGLRPGMPPTNPGSTAEPLLGGWGIGFDGDKAIGDPVNALRSQRPSGIGRPVEVVAVQWLGLREPSFVTDDPALAELNSLFMTTAGSFTAASDGVEIAPLVMASAQAGTINAAAAGDPGGDARALQAGIKPTGTRPVLAARIKGEIKSAYPDGKPEGSEFEGEHLGASTQPLNLVVVGDADMLMDRNWIRKQRLLGQEMMSAFGNNGDFALNMAEQMIGGAGLSDLRGRGISWRPFEKIVEIEQDAQSRYLATEQALTSRLQQAETRLRELSQQGGEGTDLMSGESLQEIEKFRADMLSTRAELREVQYNLRAEVDGVKAFIKALNVGVLPALFAALALALALRRPSQTVPSKSTP
ncbi:MAG: GldG family protein [Burkholderiaceae bacterium]